MDMMQMFARSGPVRLYVKGPSKMLSEGPVRPDSHTFRGQQTASKESRSRCVVQSSPGALTMADSGRVRCVIKQDVSRSCGLSHAGLRCSSHEHGYAYTQVPSNLGRE